MIRVVTALAGNAGLLLALAVLYDAMGFRKSEPRSVVREAANGFLLGVIGVAVMLVSLRLSPGLVFDTRSVVLSLGALFFGAVPALVAILATGAFRLAMGGPGAAMGVAVIVLSAAIGLAWRHVRSRRLEALTFAELYVFGVVVHLGMLSCTLLLPGRLRGSTLAAIALPVMVVYPVATALAGWVLHSAHERHLGDEAAKALRASERRFRAVFESAEDPIFIKDRDRRYLLANPAMAKLWEKEPSAIIGRTDRDLFGEEGERTIAPADEQVLAGHVVCDTDVLVIGGRQSVFSVTKTSLKDDTGKVTGIAGIARDITGRVRAEQELKRLNLKLEARVAERTRELEQRTAEAERLNSAMLHLLEDLRAQQRLTEEASRQLAAANRELESFAYSVSHDLRAPLRAIDGFSEALTEELGEGLDDLHKDYLDRIRAAAQRMGGMIDDLLKLSQSSLVEMQRQPVDLSALALKVAEELRDGEPGRTVDIEIQPGLTTEGDPQLLRLVLQNLIGNAWKFTAPREKARIEIGRLDENGQNILYVRDNGVGFDMSYADKLFDAFQRLHRREEFPGTGIGLATVKRIVLRHGGRVWARSEPGAGATFFFTVNERPGQV